MSSRTPRPANAFSDPSISRTFVFSHPNHELAVFGLVQRLRPALIFLTDGGAASRVAQTRRGLDSIGMLNRARFLDYSEAAFYAGLLDCDLGLFTEICRRLRDHFDAVPPAEVFCDAVELYNPVHDLTLPLVETALATRPTTLYEIPLIYQDPTRADTYHVQRLPAAERGDRITVRLTAREVTAKTSARDRIYTELAGQLGPVLMSLTPEHLAVEEVAPARKSLTAASTTARALRYESRAQLLQASGQIARAITRRDHYLPIVRALADASA